MARDGRIILDWVDDTYEFRLGVGQWAQLQEACDAGPYMILSRLQNGSWNFEDIWAVIRIGLVGGGMLPADALKKTRLHKDEPPMPHLQHAIAILTAGLMGAPEERVGEQEAASPENELTISQTDDSDLPPSTETAQPQGSRRKKSTK